MHESEYHKIFQFESNHWWFAERRRLLRFLLQRFLPDHGAKILDVGCGTGHHLLYVQRLGYQAAQGIERSPLAYAFCKQLGLQHVVQGDAAATPYGDGQFDAVLVLDVLEHLPDDNAGMREIWRILKPGGLVILTVPAFHFLWSRHDKILEHYRRYRLRDVETLAKRQHFSVEHSSYFFCAIFPLVVTYRYVAKLLRLDRTSDLEATAEPFNSLLKVLGRLEIGLVHHVHRLPFGTSLAVVLKKIGTNTVN